MFSKKEFMLRIIENSTLLAHEQFAELMIALFHLEEQLFSRLSVSRLTLDDREHINIDIAKVYRALLKEWISQIYLTRMQRLKLGNLTRGTRPPTGVQTHHCRRLFANLAGISSNLSKLTGKW